MISFTTLLIKFLGYSLAIASGNYLHRCTFELFRECNNIYLGNVQVGAIWSLLRQKLSYNFQVLYIVCALVAIIVSTEISNTIKHSDFFMVFLAIVLAKEVQNHCPNVDTCSNFVRNSGLDSGSFMAYSFFRGYIQIVVPSSSDTYSKDLKERIEDYEATEHVKFPIKKLLILQPESMYIPHKLSSEFLEEAKSLEEIRINRGGVMNRSYQVSVYRLNIEGHDWYVTVQGASPLLTYYDESKVSKLLEMYKFDVGISFRDHLKKLIWNDLSCRELVEVIYYKDLNQYGERVDVGLVLKKFLKKTLVKKTANDL